MLCAVFEAGDPQLSLTRLWGRRFEFCDLTLLLRFYGRLQDCGFHFVFTQITANHADFTRLLNGAAKTRSPLCFITSVLGIITSM